MTQLARKLGLFDYFSLGFGTIVGVGWLVVMDDWLRRGGPLGAIVGFLIGGVVILPVGYVYGRLVMTRPDAAGEIAYTADVFPRVASFATGWMMLLSYVIVPAWEAVAIGKIAAYIFPKLDSYPLYRVGEHAIFLPHLVLGALLIGLVAVVNHRGIRLSATFQSVTTLSLLLRFVVFGSAGLAHGSIHNFKPLFNHTPLIAILLVLQIVPYFMSGFDSIGKTSEEARPEFQSKNYLNAILLSIGVAVFFYTAVIAVVAFAQPWSEMINERFATAVAIERAVGKHTIANVVLFAALISLIKVFNGTFIAATRLLFALSRRGLITPLFAGLHRTNQTPTGAVLAMSAVTAVAMLLGGNILIPVTEVGSIAAAFGWMMTCAAYFRMNFASYPGVRPALSTSKRRTWDALIAVLGIFVSLAMILMKLLPFLPGHFTRYEYVALAVWLLVGMALCRRPDQQSPACVNS